MPRLVVASELRGAASIVTNSIVVICNFWGEARRFSLGTNEANDIRPPAYPELVALPAGATLADLRLVALPVVADHSKKSGLPTTKPYSSNSIFFVPAVLPKRCSGEALRSGSHLCGVLRQGRDAANLYRASGAGCCRYAALAWERSGCVAVREIAAAVCHQMQPRLGLEHCNPWRWHRRLRVKSHPTPTPVSRARTTPLT